MNSRKIIGIIIIIVGLIAIVGIVYMLFFNRAVTTPARTNINSPSSKNNGAVEKPATNSNTKNPPRKITANLGEDLQSKKATPTKRSQEEITKDDLKRIAGSFVERFGSYSNQSNYSNIRDLKIFMSKKMRLWADSYIEEQSKKNTDNNLYYGIITKTVTEDLEQYNDEAGIVSIKVDTRRREAVGTSANFSDVFNQNIQVKFTKEKGVWKVDSANWQER